MTIKKPATVLLVGLVSFIGLGQPASAAWCEAELAALRGALNNGYCVNATNERCEGLNNKLDNVARKLDKDKFRNAARKLANFGEIVDNMANRKKKRQMQTYDYDSMVGPFAAVANCIEYGGKPPQPEPEPEIIPQPDWDLDNE